MPTGTGFATPRPDADKAVARVLVEMHNKGMFEAGLTLVGTLCCMAWLNELGARAVAARTQDIDLARRQHLKLGAPLPFLRTMQDTHTAFRRRSRLGQRSPAATASRCARR
jgi:hypothetical protein